MSDETKFSLIDLPEIPDSVDNAFQNLTDVPSKNVGQTFGDLWYLVFGGITQAADKKRMKYAHDLQIYNQELTAAIERIPETKKIEPSVQVTAQALENSKYCISSETLRAMFVKLISGTMHIDMEPLTHPSFPEMIKQMDDVDAHILMELKRNGDVPIVNYKQITAGQSGYVSRFENAYISTIFNHPLNICNSSLISLERMGLVKLSYETYFTNDALYEPFRNTDVYNSLCVEFANQEKLSVEIKKGMCSITPLGKRFITTCVS